MAENSPESQHETLSPELATVLSSLQMGVNQIHPDNDKDSRHTLWNAYLELSKKGFVKMGKLDHPNGYLWSVERLM